MYCRNTMKPNKLRQEMSKIPLAVLKRKGLPQAHRANAHHFCDKYHGKDTREDAGISPFRARQALRQLLRLPGHQASAIASRIGS